MEEDSLSCFGTPETMDADKPRGESWEKGLATKSKEKKIPHYLRPSTGSCHDLCKYGKRQQLPVEKPWHSTTKKMFKKSPVDVLIETSKPSSSKSKKVMEIKKKTVTDDCSEIIKREVVSGVSSGIKKPEALIISSSDENPMKKKTTLKPLQDSGSGNVDALKKKALTKSYSAVGTSKSKVKNEQVASSSPVLKPKTGKTVTVSSKKVPVTPRSSIRLAGNSSLRKSQSLKTASSSSSRPNQKPRRVINRTDESNKELDVYPVKEKTLHVVEMETTNKVVEELFPPTQSIQKDDECTVSEADDYDYPSESNEAESGEEEKKPRVTDSPEEAARKLRFRRGKVVEADDVGEGARKLKFRKGRGLGEEKAEDGQVRRSFKKREDVKEEVGDDGEKVVLRHQDVQEKDAQGLFNNVIEETASKLVEARKSKVKALVGAFETVISLQES